MHLRNTLETTWSVPNTLRRTAFANTLRLHSETEGRTDVRGHTRLQGVRGPLSAPQSLQVRVNGRVPRPEAVDDAAMGGRERSQVNVRARGVHTHVGLCGDKGAVAQQQHKAGVMGMCWW